MDLPRDFVFLCSRSSSTTSLCWKVVFICGHLRHTHSPTEQVKASDELLMTPVGQQRKEVFHGCRQLCYHFSLHSRVSDLKLKWQVSLSAALSLRKTPTQRSDHRVGCANGLADEAACQPLRRRLRTSSHLNRVGLVVVCITYITVCQHGSLFTLVLKMTHLFCGLFSGNELKSWLGSCVTSYHF